MRTILLLLAITGLLVGLGACSLYFDSHGSNSGTPPDANDPQQPLPDASTGDVDAGPGDPADAGSGGCNPDGGGEFPDADFPDFPDAGWSADAPAPPADAGY
ncbi:MAG: hypothetical protein ABI867_24180 [Kofleriaceae bacterium]